MRRKRRNRRRRTFTSRRDDAWYVVAAGAVDVHVSVPGDAHGANLAGSVSEDADRARVLSIPVPSEVARGVLQGEAASRRRRARCEEHGAASPRAATLRAGAFFGALDDAFAADPNATVVFVAAEPTTVLFAVPGERFKPREDEKKKRCLTSARVRSRLSATTTTTTTTTRATTRRRGARDAKKKMSKRASRLFSRKSSRSANATRRSWTDSPSFPPRSRRSSARF